MATTIPYGDLATGVNQFMTQQSIAPFLANLPNYANMVGKRSENITQQLGGQLPQDVIQQISQQAAERGIAGGAPGGPNSGAAYLRALGLNSLQMQQQGSQDLSHAIADTPVPELWNPMSLYIPQSMSVQQQQYAVQGQNAARAEQQRKEDQAKSDAASRAWQSDYLKRMGNYKNSSFY